MATKIRLIDLLIGFIFLFKALRTYFENIYGPSNVKGDSSLSLLINLCTAKASPLFHKASVNMERIST